MDVTKRKIRLIVRELGRVNSRLNTLKHVYQDIELVQEIATLIARRHAGK
jgi:Ni,Fe-hydrogenase III large subunit